MQQRYLSVVTPEAAKFHPSIGFDDEPFADAMNYVLVENPSRASSWILADVQSFIDVLCARTVSGLSIATVAHLLLPVPVDDNRNAYPLAFCTSSRACPIWHGRIPLLEFRQTARPSVPPQPLVQALPNRRDCGLRLGQLRDLCAKEGEASAGPAAASNHIMPMFRLGRAARSRIEMENAGKAERR
ncbi:hypothetical protein B0H13DRAFT_2661084 [Mycena leptocephala]|nr:hypothetical protein B0H13DRAFT_2661084 [Mycena leptocephala]